MTDQSSSQAINRSDRLTDFRSMSLQDLMSSQVQRPEWLVDQLIPCDSIACIAGRPKVGKSFAVLELAMCIASGEPLFGRFEVSQKNVLLISKEDSEVTLKERLENMGVNPELNIAVSTDQNIYFDDDSMVSNILGLARKHESQVVIIDSFIRVFRGDENTSRSIALVHKVFKEITEKGITVIFVHHHGKEDSQGGRSGGDKLRGSSDIYAMIDTLLTVRRENNNTLMFSNDANRHRQRIQSFYVSFPSFDDEDCRFKFLGFVDGVSNQDVVRPVDKAVEEIQDLLKESVLMHQADIIRTLTSGESDYGSTTIKNALNKLENMSKLVVGNVGNRKMYSLPAPIVVVDKGEGGDQE